MNATALKIVDPAPHKPRKYQPIWEAVAARLDAGNFEPVRVHIPRLTETIFRRIRKAFWKEIGLDLVRRVNWQAKVWRGAGTENEMVFFTVVPKVGLLKDRI